MARRRTQAVSEGIKTEVLSKSKSKSKDSYYVTRETRTPRHGISVRCPKCSWNFKAGGIADEAEAKNREQDAIKKHRRMHQRRHSSKSKTKTKTKTTAAIAEFDASLHIERYFHAAEIPHFFDEQATRQTTTSTTYVDVPDAAITSGLAANQDNLIIVAAQVDMTSSSAEASVRMVRGSTPTAIDDSEATLECNTSGERMTYNWWGVINPGASAQDIKMQFKITSATIGVDLITITVIKLSPDLTLNTDYKYQQLSTSTSYTTLEADLATGNATIALTPATAGHRWLILGKSRSGTGINSLTAISSRIEHSGGATNSYPEAKMEGEDASFAQYVLMTMRVDTLSAVSHTYTEISRQMESGAGAVANSSRTHSGIFMMDLDKFESVSTVLQEDNTQELPNGLTAYAENVATTTITPAVAGHVLCLGYTTMDAGGSNFTYKMRMQIDNTDPQDLPTGSSDDVTGKSYNIVALDTGDRIPLLYSYVETLSAAAHTLDIDGSVNNDIGSEGTLDRSLVAFSMELAGASAIKAVIGESIAMTEGKVFLKGIGRTLLKSESLSLSETFLQQSSATSNLIQSTHFVMRLSGGVSNTSGNASLGGVMSTAAGGVLTDILQLWDHVSQTDSTAGDTEWRQFYITNTHPTQTMQDVTLWVENTPGGDEIRIGVGSAAMDGQEQTIANENTAPSSVTVVLAPSLAQGLHCGNVGPNQKRSVWVRRFVPPNTGAHAQNNYKIRARFWSNAVGFVEASFDANHIQYPQPLLTDGYRLSFGNEAFTFVENFRTDGSMRCNFLGVRNSVMLAGYFRVVGATIPNEEVSAEMNGGPHTSTGTSGSTTVANDTWADTMDLGIVDFEGADSRVRFEATHPNYSSAYAPTTESLPISDIRNVWRGFIGLKVNLDTDDDGQPDKVAIIGMVDTGGLDGSNVPVNSWIISYKRIFDASEIQATGIKSLFTPYVATIGHPEAAENTVRIDGQVYADWTNANVSLRPYKYVTCKEVFVTNI